MATFAILGWAFVVFVLYRARKIKEIRDFYRGALDMVKSIIYMEDVMENNHYNDPYDKGATTAMLVMMASALILALVLIVCSIGVLIG